MGGATLLAEPDRNKTKKGVLYVLIHCDHRVNGDDDNGDDAALYAILLFVKNYIKKESASERESEEEKKNNNNNINITKWKLIK